jgi:hypothetical protein
VWLGRGEVVAAQQHRRQERTAVAVGADDLEVLRIAGDELGDAAQGLERAQHLLALVEAGERAHGHALGAGRADDDPRQPLAGGLDDVVDQVPGDERAPDRGALLAGLNRHLGDELLDEQLELRGVRRGVRPEHRAVQ